MAVETAAAVVEVVADLAAATEGAEAVRTADRDARAQQQSLSETASQTGCRFCRGPLPELSAFWGYTGVSVPPKNRDNGPKARNTKSGKKSGFLARHSLSIVSIAVLILWIILYSRSDMRTHWGSFFGNAIADWSGVVVTVLATKYLYERGSAESRKPPFNLHGPFWQKISDHSLTLFLLATGACWVAVYKHADPESRWGQVAGNIVSEWTQILALVVLTKRLIEIHSKESKK